MGRSRTDAELEAAYQAELIKKLRAMFLGCFILKNDANYLQGVPDLLVLFENKWAMLEVKASADSAERPNQGYYVRMLDAMSFSAFIYPENEEEVLNDLEQAFCSSRAARVALRK